MSNLEERLFELNRQRDQFEREYKAWRELAESRLKEIEELEVHVDQLLFNLNKCVPFVERQDALYASKLERIIVRSPKISLAERDSGVSESERTDLMKSTTACDDQFISESGKDGE